MKAIDASEYTLIKAGKEYQPASRAEAEAKHGNKPASACSKKLVQLLHGGEAYVWWLQPRDGGLSEQVACVKVHGVLYRLNQKLEKVAFRHIRLTKHFKNVEVLSDGTQKLCIPTRLLQHKLRTSQRFMVAILSLVFFSVLLFCAVVREVFKEVFKLRKTLRFFLANFPIFATIKQQ